MLYLRAASGIDGPLSQQVSLKWKEDEVIFTVSAHTTAAVPEKENIFGGLQHLKKSSSLEKSSSIKKSSSSSPRDSPSSSSTSKAKDSPISITQPKELTSKAQGQVENSTTTSTSTRISTDNAPPLQRKYGSNSDVDVDDIDFSESSPDQGSLSPKENAGLGAYLLHAIHTIHTIHTIHAIHAIHTIHTIHTIHAIHTIHTIET